MGRPNAGRKKGRGTAGVPTTSFSDGEGTGSEAMCSSQWREIGRGGQILRARGVALIRSFATSSRSYAGLSGFGIEFLSEEPIEC
jgi:3,4-dihydroxy 2-butanone 4-phosphate synthase/GTP cyclohydrolase II